jgi:hypothetical protein
MYDGSGLVFPDGIFYSITVKAVHDGLVPVVGHWPAASIYTYDPVFFLIDEF